MRTLCAMVLLFATTVSAALTQTQVPPSPSAASPPEHVQAVRDCLATAVASACRFR